MAAVWYKLLKIQQEEEEEEEEEDFMKLALVRALLLAQMFAPFTASLWSGCVAS